MTSDNNISSVKHKPSDFEQVFHTGVEQLILEIQWTDYLQKELDYCNAHYFKNFKLRLERE